MRLQQKILNSQISYGIHFETLCPQNIYQVQNLKNQKVESFIFQTPNNYMDFNPLWVIKCDQMLLVDPPDYVELMGIINNQAQFLQECHEPGLKFHLHEIIRIMDSFLSPQRIIQVVASRHQIFSDDELTEIETKTTELRILIECQKKYANKYWLHKKQDEYVEIRIMACLLRIYMFLQRLWLFFVGEYPNIKTRMTKSKLILPLSKLEPFVNQIYSRLQKIEPYYYKYENQRYVIETHVLFKAFKQLLFQFPTITRKQVFKNITLKYVIFAQNQTFKRNFLEKFMLTPQSPIKKPKVRPRRNTDITQEVKVKSLDHRNIWSKRFSMNLKVHKPSNSLAKISQAKQTVLPAIKYPFRPIVISRRQKHITQSSLQRTNSDCASTRNISDSRSFIRSISKLSVIDQHIPRQSMSPTRIPKTKSRRTIVDSYVMGAIQQQPVYRKSVNFQFQTMKQKQTLHYTLAKYHEEQIRDNRAQSQFERLALGHQEMQICGTFGRTATEIQQQIQYLLQKKVNLKPLKRNKYHRQSIDQP